MKRLVGGVALIFVAHSAFATAIQYDFIQITREDSDRQQATEFSARAVVDGARTRVDFLTGTAYPPGTYVISNDGARRLLFVDPTQKLYTEVNTLSVASALGTSNILIENFQPTVTKMPGQITVAGIPADHYRLVMTYDITVNFRSMPLKQSVRTEIDKWTTTRFADAATAFFGTNIVQTGNAQIDQMISAEATKIDGFPLKQTIKITVINQSAGKLKSELKLPQARTKTREITVTSIRETKPDQSLFTIPAGYVRTDFATRVNKSQTQVLSMEPSSE